jgi:hypothetical protein
MTVRVAGPVWPALVLQTAKLSSLNENPSNSTCCLPVLVIETEQFPPPPSFTTPKSITPKGKDSLSAPNETVIVAEGSAKLMVAANMSPYMIRSSTRSYFCLTVFPGKVTVRQLGTP